MNPVAEAIKRAIDPADYYGTASGRPTAEGWSEGGLCPFHADSHPGSYRVNLKSGGFICFACGEKGGDLITHYQKVNDVSFAQALKELARLAL
jgi:DNA primase